MQTVYYLFIDSKILILTFYLLIAKARSAIMLALHGSCPTGWHGNKRAKWQGNWGTSSMLQLSIYVRTCKVIRVPEQSNSTGNEQISALIWTRFLNYRTRNLHFYLPALPFYTQKTPAYFMSFFTLFFQLNNYDFPYFLLFPGFYWFSFPSFY